MTKHELSTLLKSAVAAAAVLFSTCTSDSPVAGATETGDARVVGSLAFENSKPAAGAVARFVPMKETSYPVTAKEAVAAAEYSAVTNSKGDYAIDSLPTGFYNVFGSGDGKLSYQDSVFVRSSTTTTVPTGILKDPGSLAGVVRFESGEDSRTIIILAVGPNLVTSPNDSAGNFFFDNMAEGRYRMRFLPTMGDFRFVDTAISIVAGRSDTLDDALVLRFSGLPTPNDLRVTYDTLRQAAILSWSPVSSPLVSGFNVYRSDNGGNFQIVSTAPLSSSATSYRDSGLAASATYEYRVVSRDAAGQQSAMLDVPGDSTFAAPCSLVQTHFTVAVTGGIGDSAAINDTVRIAVAFANPTRLVTMLSWTASPSDSVVRQLPLSTLAGRDSMTFVWRQSGMAKIVLAALDAAGHQSSDTIDLTIVGYTPTAEAGHDTVVGYGTSVHLRGTAVDMFGSIVVKEWSFRQDGQTTGFIASSGDTTLTVTTDVRAYFRGIDDDGNVTNVDSVRVRVSPRPVVLSLDSTGGSAAYLSWSAGIDGDFAAYAVYISTDSGITATDVPCSVITDVQVTHCTVTGLGPSTVYYARVDVIDSTGVASPSNEVRGTTSGRDILSDVLDLSGGRRTKCAWVRWPWCDDNYRPDPDRSDLGANTKLCVYDSYDNVTRYLDTSLGSHIRPRIDRSGNWVVWNDTVNSRSWVRDFSGLQPKRTLIDGSISGNTMWFAAAFQYDSSSGKEYVYCLNAYSNTGYCGNDTLYRIPFSPTSGTVDLAGKSAIVLRGSNSLDMSLGVSADGKKIGMAFPWPSTYIYDVAAARFDLRHTGVFGCHANLAPDNSYRFFHGDDDNFGVVMFDAGMSTTNWHVDLRPCLPAAPSGVDMYTWAPRWTNDVGFFSVASQPLENPLYSETGDIFAQSAQWVRTEVKPWMVACFVLGRWSADFKSVAKSVVIASDPRYAELEGDSWIAP